MKNSIFTKTILCSLWFSGLATANSDFSDFSETLAKNPQKNNSASMEQEQTLKKQEYLDAGLKKAFAKAIGRTVVPGMMSSSLIPSTATIVGPNNYGASFRHYDRVYLQWTRTTLPKIGDEFNVYAPGIVLQNLDNPSDFYVRNPLAQDESMPKQSRLAGYLYQSSGKVRIDKVTSGLVEGILDSLYSQVGLGDQLMPLLPVYEQVPEISGNFELTAAVVCGSPSDRISTTTGSTIYLNRGSRDGVRVGHIYEALENVRLDSTSRLSGPAISLGEAKVIYVTDSFSTAIITKQFDVIGIGTLVHTKSIPILGAALSIGMPARITNPKLATQYKEQQSPQNTGPQSPQGSVPKGNTLSELDQLEKSMSSKELSPEERKRLETVSRQQKVTDNTNLAGDGAPEGDAGLFNEDGTPGVPQVDNSFAKDQSTVKKDDSKKKKKKKSQNDEQELNLLMMQN